jgi:knotted carbamoyltransferase YgeW
MTVRETRELIDRLGRLETTLFQKDFLLTWEQTDADIEAVVLIAEILENMYRANLDTRVFRTGLALSNFRDKSTRTRMSFASASSLLGLSLLDFDESKAQIAHGETVRETANMISFVTEVIGIRDDLFLDEGHRYMAEVSRSVQQGYEEGVLPQRPAVINLQCDQDHPTQSLCDLLHLKKTFGSLDALRGKKIAMTWAYSPSYGKPMSVAQGIITLMTRFGMDVSFAYPEGYDVIPDLVDVAHRHARTSGGTFTVSHDMKEAFADADVVYPKSWAPFRVMQKRTEQLRAGGITDLKSVDKQDLAEHEAHRHWECTEDMMKLTRGGNALYMHCLPADISGVNCEHGEVAASVFDRYRVPQYHQAEHKLYVIAAMMMLTRFENPANVLRSKLLDSGTPRRMW